VTELVQLVREPAGAPDGALVLLHGRGADEHDLFPLLDRLDPARRSVGVVARAPLSLPPGGAHWYRVHEIGYPDPDTFHPTFELASAWLDSLPERTGVPLSQTVLGGFSQGAVMSYALGLGIGRPSPAAIIALSGFIPTVPGFELDLGRAALPVAIGHGTLDPVIGVQWGREARDRLAAARFDVVYRETEMGHSIDPRFLDELVGWIDRALETARPPSRRGG
jgi:phospholipase/carboxylesterase